MIRPEQLPAAIQKNILNIAVIAIGAIVAWKIYGGQMQQVNAVKAETQVALQKNDVLAQIVQSEKSLKNLRRSINNKDETSVIDVLNNIAKNSRVKIIELKPIPEQKVLGYTRYPFALAVGVDNYHTLGKFISALESNPFLFTIDNIAVNSEDSDESRPFRLQVSLEVSTILIKD